MSVSRAPGILSCYLGHIRDCASAALTFPWHCVNRTTLEGSVLLFSFPEHHHCAQSQSCAAQGPPPCTVLTNNSVPGHVLAVVKRHVELAPPQNLESYHVGGIESRLVWKIVEGVQSFGIRLYSPRKKLLIVCMCVCLVNT